MKPSEVAKGAAAAAVPCLIPADRLAVRVAELARQISTDYAGCDLVLVGVLKGAWVFMADLVRQLTIPVQCDFVRVSSYGHGTAPATSPRLLIDVAMDLAGRHVLIVEDIVDTGLSLVWVQQHLSRRQPASLKVCALLDKPSRREVPVEVHYTGFVIPDRFVVGYGIDYAEEYRQLPYVGYIPSPARAAPSGEHHETGSSP